MAYMPGGTVADMIKKGPLPLATVVRLVEQIAEGLDHAHNRGIIHRDFKPSNVLLDANGNAYLADFGIAKVSESTVALTGSGIVGTPAYMAPEMAEHGDISASVDIYALGVTLYQMLTGKYPFAGETPIRVMMAHTQDPIPDVREARSDLPEAVTQVVKKAMAKKPTNRYRSAGELAAALQAAASGKPLPAASGRGGETMLATTSPVLPPTPTPSPAVTPPLQAAQAPHDSTPPPPPTPPPPGRRRMPTWLIIVGGVAVIALGVCLCLVVSPAMFSGEDSTKANLVIDNQSGATVCKVDLAIAGSGGEGVEQLGSNQVSTGSTFRLTGINPGAYDISAYDCDGNALADDKNITLPAGDFIWTISPQ
jgi:serine/threonine-protein kinase